jgi:cell division septum initiation protein DivIVA
MNRYFYTMNKLPAFPDFQGLTKEEYDALVATLQQRIEQLHAEKKENEKELADLSARKAYLDKTNKK